MSIINKLIFAFFILTWFFILINTIKAKERNLNMTLVYENNSSGSQVSGVLTDLSDAVLAGKKIKVKIVNAAGHTEVWEFDRAIVASNGQIFAEAPLRMANFNIDGSGTQTFTNYPNSTLNYQGVAVFGTNGKEIVKIGSNVYNNSMAMCWYVE